MYGELLALMKRIVPRGLARSLLIEPIIAYIEQRDYVKLKKFLRNSEVFSSLINFGMHPARLQFLTNMDTSKIVPVGPIEFPAWRRSNVLKDFLNVMAILDSYVLGIPDALYRVLVNMEAAAHDSDLSSFRALLGDLAVHAELVRVGVEPARIHFWAGTALQLPFAPNRFPGRTGVAGLRRRLRDYDAAADDIAAAIPRAVSKATASVSAHVLGADAALAALNFPSAIVKRAARQSGDSLLKKFDDAEKYLHTNSKHLHAMGNGGFGYVAPDMTSLMHDFAALDLATSAYRSVPTVFGIDAQSAITSMAAGEPIIVRFDLDYEMRETCYKHLILTVSPRAVDSVAEDDIEVRLFLNTSEHVLSDYLIPIRVKRAMTQPGEFHIDLDIPSTSLPVHRVVAKAYIMGVNEAAISFQCVNAFAMEVATQAASTSPALFSAVSADPTGYIFDTYHGRIGMFAKKFSSEVMCYEGGTIKTYALPGAVEYFQYISRVDALRLMDDDDSDDDGGVMPFMIPMHAQIAFIILQTDTGLVCNLYTHNSLAISGLHFLRELIRLPAYNVRAYALNQTGLVILRVTGSTLFVDMFRLPSSTRPRSIRVADGFRPDEQMSITRAEAGVEFNVQFAYWRANEVHGGAVFNEYGGGPITIERTCPFSKQARPTDAILYVYRANKGAEYVVLGRYDRAMDVPGVPRPADESPLEVRRYTKHGKCIGRFGLPASFELLIAAKHSFNGISDNMLQLFGFTSPTAVTMLTCSCTP